MTSRLEVAAARYCAARNRVSRAVVALERCERRRYFRGTDNPDGEIIDPANENDVFTDHGFCRGSNEYQHALERDPTTADRELCGACRRNGPKLLELQAARRTLGGYMRAMLAEWRNMRKEGT